ncbi:MAG TPA: bifunctional phosphopantothenoylcysteine decarboxylase/phosphopantothenate--cysteine ligase CoaBC [Cytophagales bacterium]|nr:bifunctional phosphopantothenoylcysteine decarboxylase/phosphopantothenate--cysteine ligase CoaBC [Cytophagales bacterium]
MLQNKKIIIGVCGGIAAYKVAYLIRGLVKEGAEVKVIMTSSAQKFITPLTLSTLSKNPVLSSFQKNDSGEWNNHVELGLWADAMVIAPATASTIAKCATGNSDNFLCSVYLSARCPVFFAPAMDLDMYRHSSVQKNLSTLQSYGNNIIDAEEGELASGLIGVGRMAEPATIIAALNNHFTKKKLLKEKKILITAGPTFEALDPVRFIGNHSSGKMGYALAEAFAEYGGEVTLISGPTHLKTGNTGIRVVNVVSAQEMYEATKEVFNSTDIAVFAAAVADYRPCSIAPQKIKKTDAVYNLELVKNVDIAKELGKVKTKKQFTVGFALETDSELVNAFNKIKSKNFDLIVLNSLNDPGAGFKHDTNRIKIIDKNNKMKEFELKDKKEVALDIIESILSLISKHE